MSKDRIMDIVFVTLLISFILLTSIAFIGFEGTERKNSKTGLNIDGDITNILEPQSYSLSLGNDRYTKLNKREDQLSIWKLSKAILTKASPVGSPVRMSAEEWYEVYKKPGVCLIMPDGVSVRMLIEAELKSFDVDSGLNTLMLKSDETGSIYLSDSKQGIFMRYEIKGKAGIIEDFNGLSSEIYKISNNNPDKYKMIGSVLIGNALEAKSQRGVYNTALIPIEDLSGINAFVVENSYDKYKKSSEETTALEDKVRNSAARIFGKEIGFVKMFRGTDESTTYIAGYGDMTLRYKNKGGMSFNISPSLKKVRPTVKNIFGNGIRQGVAVMNEFYKSDTQYALGSYKEVSVISEINQTIKMTYLMDGMRSVDIVGKNSPSSEIKLSNGVVTEFNIFPVYKLKEYDIYTEKADIQSIILSNRKLIAKEISAKNGASRNGQRAGGNGENGEVNAIIEKINDISVKYAIVYDTNANTPTSKLAMPVWSIKVGSYELIFSYYSGEFIKTIMEQ